MASHASLEIDVRKEHQIIAIVHQIIESGSLSLYTNLWRLAGFTITRNYNDLNCTTTLLQFSSVPLHNQIANFCVAEKSSEEPAAWRLIDLVLPLLGSSEYRNYFDLWENAGFYITPVTKNYSDEKQFKPNLFLLGAAKCGTTTLHRYLDEISSICMSRPKEPFFFEAEYELGLDFYRQKYFKHWKGEPIIGDARHRDLYLPHIARRIFAINPQAKLVVIVRNPIERAYSHWWHWYAQKIEELEFPAAIKEDIDRIEAGWFTQTRSEMDIYPQVLDWTGKGLYRSYVDSGYYYQQICRYLDYFPKEQMKVVLFEDFQQDNYSSIKEIETFLGTDYYREENFSLKKENVHLPENGVQRRTPILPDFRAYLRNHYQQHNADLANYLKIETYRIGNKPLTPTIKMKFKMLTQKPLR